MSNISPTELQSAILKCTFFLDFLFFKKQVTLIIQAYLTHDFNSGQWEKQYERQQESGAKRNRFVP